MNTAEAFAKKGYVVIRNLVAEPEVARLYQHTLDSMPRGNFKDKQVNGSPSFYQDKQMVVLHQKILNQIEAITETKLFATFCFNRVYRKGAILRTHKDRRACEIAVTLNLGQQGELWDLWLMDNDENANRVALAPGDAIIYQGSRLNHWRGKLENADYVSQVLFFFINQKGRDKVALIAEWFTRFLAKF